MMNRIEEVFLSLVRLGIGNSKIVFPLPKDVDWNALEELAARQGLSAVMVDGIEKLPEEMRPPKQVLLQWIGETLQGFEYRYELYRRTIAELAAFYNQHGFKMMIVKGFACNLDWPKPEHRPCGDIDIWLFGKQREADAALVSWFKVQGSKARIDTSHHHHTVFDWQGFTVENHYDFINVHHHKSNVELDRILKELTADDSNVVEVNGEKVIVPSADFNAFFLLRHAMNHFSSSEITIRQLLDWAFFVKKHTKEIDWKLLEKEIEQFGMRDLYNVFNAICVGDLGFEVNIFPKVQFDPTLKDRVLKEIIEPGFSGVEPKGIIRRVIFKYRRWKANGWKHELCFKESMWSAFWSGVWSHILKPSSI